MEDNKTTEDQKMTLYIKISIGINRGRSGQEQGVMRPLTLSPDNYRDHYSKAIYYLPFFL